MRRPDRRHVLALLGATALGACSPDFQTGQRKKPPKGGLGGTGIVGTLTDFGSLIVNGLTVELSAETRITDALGVVAETQIGQALTVEATTEDDTLIAKRVHITHPVIGIVEQVDAQGRRGVVAGVRVELEDSAIGRLVPGNRVAVCGLWRGIVVIASRVDPLESNGPSVIAGVVQQPLGGTGRIAGVALLGQGTSLPGPGEFATVVGRYGPAGLVPAKVTPGRFFGAAGPLTRLSVEGFLEPSATAPFYAVSGLGHSFDREAKLRPFLDRRVVFSGDYEGTFVVRDGVYLPQNFAERRERIAAMVRDASSVELVPAR